LFPKISTTAVKTCKNLFNAARDSYKTYVVLAAEQKRQKALKIETLRLEAAFEAQRNRELLAKLHRENIADDAAWEVYRRIHKEYPNMPSKVTDAVATAVEKGNLAISEVIANTSEIDPIERIQLADDAALEVFKKNTSPTIQQVFGIIAPKGRLTEAVAKRRRIIDETMLMRPAVAPALFITNSELLQLFPQVNRVH